jgi:hypothetical protein
MGTSIHQVDQPKLLLLELSDDLSGATVEGRAGTVSDLAKQVDTFDRIELDGREDLDPCAGSEYGRESKLRMLPEKTTLGRRHLEPDLDRQNHTALFDLMKIRCAQIDVGVLFPVPIEPVVEDRQHCVTLAVHELRHSDVFIRVKHRHARVGRVRVRHTRHVAPAEHRGEEIAPGVVRDRVVGVLVAEETVLEARVEPRENIDGCQLIDVGVVRDRDDHRSARVESTSVLRADDTLTPRTGVDSRILDEAVAAGREGHDGSPEQEHREEKSEGEHEHSYLLAAIAAVEKTFFERTCRCRGPFLVP